MTGKVIAADLEDIMQAKYVVEINVCVHSFPSTMLSEHDHFLQGKIRVLEKCGCDDDCACENLILEQGGMWKSIFTNASKRLRIGSSPEVGQSLYLILLPSL